MPKKKDVVQVEGDKPEITPLVTEITGGELPEGKKDKKPRKPRSPNKPQAALVDFQLPIGGLMIALTDTLAENLKGRGIDPKRAECWRMSDKEEKQFEAAFNNWATVRAPMLEKWYPEIAIVMSLANWSIRAASGIPPTIAE